MSSPGVEMSLERQIPALMKKTQMNGEHGSQCGLTSLLPMSCRGRAAAFARDLHTRLRNLGAHRDDDPTWDPAAPRPPPPALTSPDKTDLDTFYDFELECESPSSPADEFDAPFSDRSPVDDIEPPFYEFETENDIKNSAKILFQQPVTTRTNGLTFSTAFYTDASPVKLQPTPRENGNSEKHLYSPITFDDCARQNGHDEVDSSPGCSSRLKDYERLGIPLMLNSTDSDSEFESAKSEPSEAIDEESKTDTKINEDVTDVSEAMESVTINESDTSRTDTESINLETTEKQLDATEETVLVSTEEKLDASEVNVISPLDIRVSEEIPDKEVSPTSDIDISLLSSESKVDNDLESEDDRPQRVRRCSSLKTGKTPPGTPGRKKIVRFADVLGLDLADVKTFMDDIPVIPKSAYDDLTGCDMQNSPPVRAPPPRIGALTLVPLFQVARDLTEKLTRDSVCLETARVGDGVHINVCGTVRVRNLDFHKTVHVRYSMNRWKTYTDLQATYVPGSCDGFSDRFQFVLYAPCITSGKRLEIAIRFQCKGQQFWDNNSGANYCFDCLALGVSNNMGTVSSSPLHPTVDWHPSFY